MSRSSARRPVIGVMGAGESASVAECELGERLGERIAAEGWVLLTGGRDAGVMAAAIRGAKRVEGSLTIGILPAASGLVAPGLDVAIFTGMGNARNAINVLSSRVVVACGTGGAGTASEVALALKSDIPVVLVGAAVSAVRFFRKLGGALRVARSDEEAIARIRDILSESHVRFRRRPASG
jgi:uncharacterized protein (TIGR00725 family)